MEPVENENAPQPEREPDAERPLSEDAERLVSEDAERLETENEASTEEILTTEMVVAPAAQEEESAEAELRAVIEAVIYITDEPLSAQQIAAALEQPLDRINRILKALSDDYQRPDRGLTIREVAGGYKMATKPEHHEPVRRFVKNLKPPMKLSLAALETLAVIAYKQPITGPEILEIRGVQGGGVLKTLIERKLIAPSGRKAVIGKPILYKTTKEFLVQFGLKDIAELPTLKEFEELSRLALSDAEPESPAETAAAETATAEAQAEDAPTEEPATEAPEPETQAQES